MARLLDILVSTATKRISDMPYRQPPEPKPTVRQRRMLQQRQRALAVVKRVDAALDKLGFDVADCGTLVLEYTRRRNLESTWRRERDARLDRVRQLRDKALLDLIDMEPKTQKRYYIRLKQQLATL